MNREPDPDRSPSAARFHRAFLLTLAVGVSILFLVVVRRFILAVLLAALFAGLAYPVYSWLLGPLKGRRRLAAVATIVLLLVGLGLPLAGYLAVVANEAVQLSQAADDWVRTQAPRIEQLRDLVERIPFADQFIPDSAEVMSQVREVATRTGTLMMGALAAATRGTLNFLLMAFIFLYGLFYFLVEGPRVLLKTLGYMPLSVHEKARLLERFLSVTRATIKGSLLIGVIQGTAAGVAFWIAGVPGAAFWGAAMVVLSIIPAVGAGLIWVPVVIYLYMDGQIAGGTALLAWCALVVSLVDNVLRPRLIGRDAQMADLLILVSTLGGILVFGAVGFIVGPIVAALFVTVWDIYGEAFQDWLPETPEGVLGSIFSESATAGTVPSAASDQNPVQRDPSGSDDVDRDTG